MADHAVPQYATAPRGNDYPEHERTWRRVKKLARVGTGGAVCILVALTVGLVAGITWIMVLGLALSVISIVLGLASPDGRVGPLTGSLIVMLVLWAIAG
jgi:hypothetical protein